MMGPCQVGTLVDDELARKLELIAMLGNLVHWKLMTILLAGVLPIKATTNSGQSLSGNLGAINDQSLVIEIDGQTRELALDDLQSLTPTKVADQTGPVAVVTLTGGSRIAALSVSLADGSLTIEPRRQETIEIPVKAVKAIRFRPAAAVTDAQWLGQVQKEARGDVMVIRRPGDKLDPASGIIEGIGDGKVSFSIDGDVVAAPMDRLEGVVFGGTPEVADDAAIRVTDVYGSTWSVESLLPSEAEAPLQMKLSSGPIHELPLDQIESMRFSGGMSLLASVEPADVSAQASYPIKIDSGLIGAFFGPERQGEVDLQMHGGSRVEYRVADGFVTLSGTVRRAADVVKASEMKVRITLDGKTVWEESLPDVQPRGFELPIDGARRMAIEVDSLGDGDLGDTVRIIRPRLLK